MSHASKVHPVAHAKAPAFDWSDPFLLDDQLSEDERLIRDAANAYAQGKLAPRVVEAYASEKTDRAIFNEMGELGLLGVTVPEEYGGAGASYVAYGLVAREVERVDSGNTPLGSGTNTAPTGATSSPVHFERRTNAQKRTDVLSMLDASPHLSDREIARRVGVSPQTVNTWRRKIRVAKPNAEQGAST